MEEKIKELIEEIEKLQREIEQLLNDPIVRLLIEMCKHKSK